MNEEMPETEMPEELELQSLKGELKALTELHNSEAFQAYLEKLTEKYNQLYRDAVANADIEDHVIRRKIEQQRGIAYAINLIPMLISGIEDEIESKSY